MAQTFERARRENELYASVVEKLMEATVDRTGAEDLLSEIICDLGFHHFSYAIAGKRKSHRGDGIVLSSYLEEWKVRYKNGCYVESDPLIAASRRSCIPFRWGTLAFLDSLTEPMKAVTIEARDYGIVEGFTVPVHGPESECGLFSAAFNGALGDMSERWGKRYQWIVCLAPFVHAFGISSTMDDDGQAEVVLTDHERTCLSWTLRGKTAWEIAQILGKSKPTIEYHLQKAMRKLDASNKAHAAAMAMRLGLI
ncbi:LuxR family transcriptional regulator [Mesorhizobium sp. AaZ16]|uniref:helix-turn-helix transcriptional regulator n=1 Tax=Mesorhizobium sp. AaZ16 TaxID=3402289 RepID=UPI00374E87D0